MSACSATINTAIRATRRGGITCVGGAAMAGDKEVSLSAYDLFRNGQDAGGMPIWIGRSRS
uniref:Uncharacterized protein n=1 Tax=Mycobacterium avium subsp. hominissuis TaxID=439334 RepID=A0A088DKB4_MYCAV|nr:hypothetical protein [Mycobacterium avium subsp. hominissuis]